MKRFLSLLSPLVLVLAGCCHCSDARLDEHPQRPGDVVRELRDAIGDRRWDKAALCFSEEIRAKNAPDMESGRFFERDVPPVELEGNVEITTTVKRPWPFGPRDPLVGVEIDGTRAVATIDHVRLFVERDDRPRSFVLEKNADGRWQITAWR